MVPSRRYWRSLVKRGASPAAGSTPEPLRIKHNLGAQERPDLLQEPSVSGLVLEDQVVAALQRDEASAGDAGGQVRGRFRTARGLPHVRASQVLVQSPCRVVRSHQSPPPQNPGSAPHSSASRRPAAGRSTRSRLLPCRVGYEFRSGNTSDEAGGGPPSPPQTGHQGEHGSFLFRIRQAASNLFR